MEGMPFIPWCLSRSCWVFTVHFTHHEHHVMTWKNDSTPSPAYSRVGRRRRRALGDQLRDPKETTHINMFTAVGNGETRRKTCQNGWRSLLTIQWTEKLPHHAKHTHAALMSRFIQSQKWYQDYVASLRACRKTEIAKYARGPKSRKIRAENDTVTKHLEQKNGDMTTADHKLLNEECESRNSHRYADVVQDLATHCVQSLSMKNKKHM